MLASERELCYPVGLQGELEAGFFKIKDLRQSATFIKQQGG